MVRVILHSMVLFALVASTCGISLTAHFCGGNYKGIHVNDPHFHCCKTSTARYTDVTVDKTSCCANETMVLKCDLNQNKVSPVTLDSELTTWCYEQAYANLAPNSYQTAATAFAYRPPPLIFDLPVLFQSFLC